MGMQIRRVCQCVIWSIQTHKSQKNCFSSLSFWLFPFRGHGRVHIRAKARSTLGWVASSSHGPLYEKLWVWCIVQEKQLLTFKNIQNSNSAPTHMKAAFCNLAWFQPDFSFVSKLLASPLDPWVKKNKKHQGDRWCTKTDQFTIQPITDKMVW